MRHLILSFEQCKAFYLELSDVFKMQISHEKAYRLQAMIERHQEIDYKKTMKKFSEEESMEINGILLEIIEEHDIFE